VPGRASGTKMVGMTEMGVPLSLDGGGGMHEWRNHSYYELTDSTG